MNNIFKQSLVFIKFFAAFALIVSVVFTVTPFVAKAVAVQPDLIVTKTHEGAAIVNGTFKWKLRVQNIGNGDAVFARNNKILQDVMPSADVEDYGVPSIVNSGTIITGSIICNQTESKERNLKCKVSNNDGDSVVMPPGSFLIFL